MYHPFKGVNVAISIQIYAIIYMPGTLRYMHNIIYSHIKILYVGAYVKGIATYFRSLTTIGSSFPC
jgi:hypothetical protein